MEMQEQWAIEELSVKEMDEMVKELDELETKYEAAHKISSDAWKAVESQRERILSTLQRAGKSTYIVDGVGRVTVAIKEEVKVPSDLGKRQALFDYIRQVHGADTLLGYLTVNYQSLNSFYKEERANHQEGEFELSGILEPVKRPILQFRAK